MVNTTEITKLMDVVMCAHWLSEHFGDHWANLKPVGRAFVIAEVLSSACEDHGRHFQSAISALDKKVGKPEHLEAFAKDLAFMQSAGMMMEMLGSVLDGPSEDVEPITTAPAFSRN